MATIPKDRIRAWGGARGGQGAPRFIYFPVAASQTGQDGYFVNIASGAGNLVAALNSTNTSLGGVLEETITSAYSAGRLIPTTLILPGKFYEASVAGATSQSALVGAMRETKKDSDIDRPVLLSTEDSTQGVRVIAAIGSQMSEFRMDDYIGKSDTSETTGSSNTPLSPNKGVYDDTNPRVLIVFPEDVTAWQ